MLSVLVGVDDPVLGAELTAALERAGHRATWVGALEAGPGERGGPTPNVILIDGDAANLDLTVLAAAWNRYDPPPVVIVLGETAAARLGAARIQSMLIAKPVDIEAAVGDVERALASPRAVALSTTGALRVLGLAPGGMPDDEAATIVAGARHVPAHVVREALRPCVDQYVTATPLLARLRARRALTADEGRIAVVLDGTRTVRRLVDEGGLEPIAAARVLWALLSGRAAAVGGEPPADATHPGARRVALARDHLRARRARLARAPLYEVLEVMPDAGREEIDGACRLLALRFSPEALAPLDLGDHAALAGPLWTQIVEARRTLLDPAARARYRAMKGHRELEDEYDRRRAATKDAELHFARGQQALADEDVIRAVSELAAAARRMPDEPDFEAYAAWARYLMDEQRGADRAAAARRERATAETALAGRRPRARALLALGLLCDADGLRDAARGYLTDSLTCDPRLGAARNALARLDADE